MGYSLTIGELKHEITDDKLETEIYSYAEDVTLPNSPSYGEPTDYTNSRWPSYTSWGMAMEFVGLNDFMYNKKTGLLRDHPGCVPLVKEHKEIIDKAHIDFYKKYPNCKPGFSPKLNDRLGIYEDSEWPEENMWAVRLEWLKFWVDWSLENCKVPVFHNT